ncbi:MAG: OmpA family protein [Ignavibacteriae bacterium]|nr:OmpA family protein [Ignavibacteriota bacterium]
MKNLIMFAVMVLAGTMSINAQTENWKTLKYGIFGEFGIDQHIADFNKLQEIPNCCPKFTGGSGTGVSIGGLFDIPFTPNVGLIFRGSYTSFWGSMESIEPTTVISGNTLQDGSFKHELNGLFTKIGVDPLLYYSIIPNLKVNLGARLAMKVASTYDQKETIVGSTGSFVDTNGNEVGRVRNNLAGDIPNAAGLTLYGMLGLSYDMPMNSRKTLLLESTVFYYYDVNSMVSDVSWKVNSLRFGIAIKYSPVNKTKMYEEIRKVDTAHIQKNIITLSYSKGIEKTKTEIQSDDLTETTITYVQRTDTVFTQKVFALDGSIKVVGVDSLRNETSSAGFTVEEFTSNRILPLLPYIFFDDNSSVIPSKYISLNNIQAQRYSVKSLAKSETLEAYYNLLNIVGKRMQDNPTATLKIIGCNSGIGAELSNKTVSTDRAAAVKSYLQDVWKVAESRLDIESRDTPGTPSTPLNEPDKIAENRRVELYSSNYEILEPLDLSDTLRVANPPIARFKPAVNAEAGLKEWVIKASQKNTSTLNFEKNGQTNLPSAIDWMMNENRHSIPSLDNQIEVSFQVRDMSGQSKVFSSSIPVSYISINKKRQERIQDKEINRYNLILFEFSKYELKPSDAKIIDIIKKNLQPNSIISITGYTDRAGDALRNAKLSQNRANEVKEALNHPNTTVVGAGGKIFLYNNDIPEGRFYCRTVDILVETPVKQ